MSSEKGGAPAVPRSNPLYGGPSGSSAGPTRTPSWARRSDVGPSARGSSFSDVASTVASTPPDSPARDHYSRDQFGQYNPPPYEHPGYTVETPGHSDSVPPSPYHAPPYYVQTPAMSERGGTPLSSAPSSPPHYGPGGVPFIETKKKGSSRTNPMGKLNNGKFVPLNSLDEEEDEYPDLERDSRRKNVRRTWICWITLGVIVFLLGLGALITWLIFRPHSPTYTFQDMGIRYFYLQQDKPDENGVATDVVYANLSMLFTVHNRNKRYGLSVEKSSVSLGYSSLDDVITGSVGSFHVGAGKTENFTAWATTTRFPVYSAGHYLELDIANGYIPLNFVSKFNSRVSIFWKLIESSWVKKYDCLISIKGDLPYRYLNTTCETI